MRAVVDTNVTAYYVLGTPEFDAEVRSSGVVSKIRSLRLCGKWSWLKSARDLSGHCETTERSDVVVK